MSKDNQEPESRDKELEGDTEGQEEEESTESNEGAGGEFRMAVPSMTSTESSSRSPAEQDALFMVKGVVRVVQNKLGTGVTMGTNAHGTEVHCDGQAPPNQGSMNEGSTSVLAPPPNRRASTRRPPIVPGAYPIQTPHQQQQPADDSEREMVRAPGAPWDITGGISDGRASDDGTGDDEEAVDSNGGLVVANPVEEIADLPHAQLEQATQLDATARNRTKLEDQFKTTLKLLLGAALTIGILVILVAMMVPKQNDDNNGEMHTANNSTLEDTDIPSPSPSQAATALPDYILSILPVGSARTIMKEPESSPQAKAFHWLMEDSKNLPGLSDDRIRQKFILATLFYSTEGHNWANHDHWLDHSVHECDWFAKSDFALSDTIREWFGPGYMRDIFSRTTTARCNDQGFYQHLWLDQNNLGGSLPTEIFALSSLRSISIGWNRMQGAITTHLGQLSQLEGLVVGHLSGAGSIPSEVGLLANLRALALNNNNHQGSLPSEVWQLTNLDTLSLHRNPRLQGNIPSTVGKLSKLRWLAVEGCDFSGTIPTEIGRAAMLEWIIAWGNRLAGTLPSETSELTHLELIALYDTQLQGTIPSEFGALQNLFVLSLQDNRLSGSLPSELGLLTKLVEGLNVANNQLTGPIPLELGNLAVLERLVLSDNGFTGSIPSELGRLEAAQLLAFSSNSLSGAVPHELGLLQKSLHTLSLEGNPLLSGSIPEAVCNLNGTCIKGPMEACHEPLGLSFDCSSLLCGCGCPCLND